MKQVVIEGMASEADGASEDIMMDNLIEHVKESLEIPIVYAGEEAPKRFRVTISVEEMK